MMLQSRKVISDLALNMIAYSLPVIVAQAFTMPIISARSTSDYYGYVLALVSVLNIVPQTIGNSLNNVRLIRATDYRKSNAEGDYILLLRRYGTLGLLVSTVSYLLIAGDRWGDAVEFSLFVLLTIFWTIREYILVGFRLKLNYKGITISSILYAVGLAIGTFVYMSGAIGKLWILVFLLAQSLSVMYINRQFNIGKEPREWTPLKNDTQKSYIKLMIPNFLNALSVNFDRLLIYPLIGGEAVAVFYAASVFTKVISIAVTPISTVLLSYLARQDSLEKSSFKIALYAALGVSVLGYLLCVLIARPVITIIYPAYVDEAMSYVHYTSINAMLVFSYSLLRPFILKFAKLDWHLWLNVISIIAYLGLGFLFVPTYGLFGMCYALIVGSTLKLILVLAPLLVGGRKAIESS